MDKNDVGLLNSMLLFLLSFILSIYKGGNIYGFIDIFELIVFSSICGISLFGIFYYMGKSIENN